MYTLYIASTERAVQAAREKWANDHVLAALEREQAATQRAHDREQAAMTAEAATLGALAKDCTQALSDACVQAEGRVICRECGISACDSCLHGLIPSFQFTAPAVDHPHLGVCASVRCPAHCGATVPLSLLLAGRPNAIVCAIVHGASRGAIEREHAWALRMGTDVEHAKLTRGAEAVYGDGAGEAVRAAANAIEVVEDLAETSRCPTCRTAIAFAPPVAGEEEDCMSMKCEKCKKYVCSMCLAQAREDGAPFDYGAVHTHVSRCFVRHGLRDDSVFVRERLRLLLQQEGPLTPELEDQMRRTLPLEQRGPHLVAEDRLIAVARGRAHRVHRHLQSLEARCKGLVCMEAVDAIKMVCEEAGIPVHAVGGTDDYLWVVDELPAAV